LRSHSKYDKAGQIAELESRLHAEGKGWIHGKDLRIAERGQSNFYELSPEVASYGRTHIELNDSRLVHHNNWLAAQGINHQINLGAWYAPPVDTRKYPFVALVRELRGAGSAGSSVEVSSQRMQRLLNKGAGLQDRMKSSSRELQRSITKFLETMITT